MKLFSLKTLNPFAVFFKPVPTRADHLRYERAQHLADRLDLELKILAIDCSIEACSRQINWLARKGEAASLSTLMDSLNA